MKKREEIAEQYKLNLKELFETDEDFLKELETLNKEIKEITKYEGIVLENENNLEKVLNLSEELEIRIERIFIYAHLLNDFDLEEEVGNLYYGKAYKLYKDYQNMAAYIVPELLKEDYEKIEELMKKNTNLKKYEIMLKDIYRTKEHILGKSEELILTKLSETFGSSEDAYSKLVDVDLTFGEVKNEKGEMVELSESNYKSLIEVNDRNVREKVFKKFYQGYKSIINTISELLASNVKKDNILADIRKYKSSRDASLDSNNIDKKVYETLIDAINSNLDIIYKQWNIRKKVLKLDELHLYDTNVSLVAEYDKKYTYEEAAELIKNALEVLGEDYSAVLKRSFEEQWIDVMPNKNKRSGAYCTNAYLTHPYVLTNFDGRYGDVSTIAHELGHAMHYYYAAKNNHYVDYNYKIFVAEVASQVNEILLNLYILDNSTDKKEKLFVLDELIKHFKASVVRQTMFAEFESIIHEKEQEGVILTCKTLCDLYYDLNKKYYGNEIIVDEEIKYEWSRIPHFYYNFYVYQYATGYIAALKIASDIFNKKKDSLENYLKFLKLGSTVDPVSSLKIAGVDLTDKKVFKDAFLEFEREMQEFVKLIEE